MRGHCPGFKASNNQKDCGARQVIPGTHILCSTFRKFDVTVGKFTVKMTTMYARLRQKPDNSIFFFDPREYRPPGSWVVLDEVHRLIESKKLRFVLCGSSATYLNEKIRMEALTRNAGAFSRFLEIAARQNGQVTNISNIARDAGVARTTVQNYFDILIDTLIGYWVPAWKLKRSTKQLSHPKFYLFDTGEAREG